MLARETFFVVKAGTHQLWNLKIDIFPYVRRVEKSGENIYFLSTSVRFACARCI